MTRPRSQIHMLMVAASRLESGHANPKLVQDLRAAAKEAADKRAESRGFAAEENVRVERQRTLFNMLPSTNATDRLKQAMLQRAYDLMWDGRADACDAVAEWLPSDDVNRMFDAWESDTIESNQKSKWHGGI